ncbi:MAG: endonuclease domain-containing protein [Chloroflexi bacterium]|nr:endonuclease domain-containing protein [Chloroflexota bacterium]
MPTSPPSTPGPLTRRRHLRHASTPAERVLWRVLRDRQLGGTKVRRQHPCGPYILDFYVPRVRLAIEVDGETHGTDEAQAYDRARTAYLAAQGIRVLRVTNHEVMSHLAAVVAVIEAALVGGGRPSP